MVLLFVLVLWQQPGEHIPARPHRHKVAEHSGGEAPPKIPPKILRDHQKGIEGYVKGPVRRNYGETTQKTNTG